MRITVFLDGADIACCVTVPSVGAPVSWSLAWCDEPDQPAASDIPWPVERPLRLDEDESRHIGVETGYLLTSGPVSAWWRGAGGRGLPLRGALVAGAHGFVPEAVPATRGRAREVALVIGTDRATGRNCWQATGGISVWPIAEARSWEDWEDYAALAGPLPAGSERRPRGVLVVADVTP